MNAVTTAPSISHSFTMRLAYGNQVGSLARIVSTIGKVGGDIGAVDIVASDAKVMTRDITVRAREPSHQEQIIARVQPPQRSQGDQRLRPRVPAASRAARFAIQNKVPLATRDALSMAYTPGVARVCAAIAAQHRKAWQLTIKGNSVAVVSDGSAVLGLGNIGPEAAMPVMEGKAMLFKEFGGIDAYPICLRTQDTEEIIATVKHLSVGFGGINLEDISAPRCFEIERELQERTGHSGVPRRPARHGGRGAGRAAERLAPDAARSWSGCASSSRRGRGRHGRRPNAAARGRSRHRRLRPQGHPARRAACPISMRAKPGWPRTPIRAT